MAVSTFSTPAGIQQYEQLFASSGTWTVPAGVKTCEVTVLGGSDYGSNYGSSAGGYFRGIVDVTGATSVPITVGSGGTVSSTKGGASSFGTYVAAPGGGAGAFYKPSTQGWAPGNISIVTTGMSLGWNAGTTLTPSYSHVANGRMYVYSNSDSVRTSTDGINWVSAGASPLSATSGKIIYGNGIYLAGSVNLFASQVYTSTNGVNFTARNLPYALTANDITHGPAGFLLHSGTGTVLNSADGITWNTLTTSGLPTGFYYYLRGTSSYYYAFKKDNAVTNAYRSTDGVTWTSFNLNATTNTGQINAYASYNNKVYVLNATTTMQVIDGTTVSSVTIPNTFSNFIHDGSFYFGATTIYSVENPMVPITTNGFGIPTTGNGYAVVSNLGIAFGTAGNNTTNSFAVSVGYQGQAGFTWQSSGNASTNGTPGVLSAGTASSSTTYGYGIPGNGNEDGWGCGVGGRDGEGRSSYGSGAKYSAPGNQGVVRVRWWA